jgi:hypothetical protein
MMRCCSVVVTPGRWPSSISAWRTQVRNDSPPHTQLAGDPADHILLVFPVCLRMSNTIRTAPGGSHRVLSDWHGSILSKNRSLHGNDSLI